MFKRFAALFLFLFIVVIHAASLVLAADFPVPDGDVAGTLLNLAVNYKTLGVVGILSAATLVSVQAMKAFLPDGWKYKRLLTLGASIGYSVLSGILLPGSSMPSVLVTVFLTSGGAVALYEALKGAGVLASKNS